MYIICSDLEGVYVPEIWINVSKKTGIDELKLTTRDINDYDVLMKRRLKILHDNNLTIKDIQQVISHIDPIDGALDFINWARKISQFIVVSDTFAEFADPLMEKLGRPTLFCHNLTIDEAGNITNYNNTPTRQVECAISVEYGQDIDKARATLLEMIKTDERILTDPAPVVHLKELADSSVNLILRCRVQNDDYWAVFFKLNEQIYKTFNAKGIGFPFPQLTIHQAND